MAMDLRRCAACGNMIAAHSDICPVCGLTKKEIARRRLIRWAVLGLLLLLTLLVWLAFGRR